MKLTVKNFGPIAEAKNIEVSPMTIFVGPSNTGKSYLAMLIYSIYIAFHTAYQRGYFSGLFSEEERMNFIQRLLNVDKYFSDWVKIVCTEWRVQFIRCFGEEGQKMLEDGDGRFSVTVRYLKVFLDLTSPENSRLKLKMPEKESINKSLSSKYSESLKEQGSVDVDNCISLLHEKAQIPTQFRMLHYMPAIRGGIMQSHRTLVSALIERAPMAGLSRSPNISLFNGVLSDFMQKLINIRGSKTDGLLRRRPQRRDKDTSEEMEKISDDIENRILSGKINIQESEVGYPDFRYKFKINGKEHDVPLMSASSSVSELAPISLFIRHYLDAGDLFILEEPEAHLHPASQRDISDMLVQLVNAGVNVLITTHSDNILEQVSNFIYAADLPDSKKTQLDKDKCSVYLFDKPKRGKVKKTKVKKVPFDPETGLLTKDHLAVSSALYNETIRLMEQRDKANG